MCHTIEHLSVLVGVVVNGFFWNGAGAGILLLLPLPLSSLLVNAGALHVFSFPLFLTTNSNCTGMATD